ncbi:Pro-resilin [Portunus trituberculatus]|uniref:Pro-resilin n=1 Tax=Portunus trituberculatus TaxID=210409 RepID=A0A5B7HAG1_PORTR|nr:Pro-resilin [Portunus trituberculatus]
MLNSVSKARYYFTWPISPHLQCPSAFVGLSNAPGTVTPLIATFPPRPTPYAFDYGVSAGYTNFGHSEKGNGHGGVTGGYWVNLPDGRVQKVSYVADYGGFRPVVSYSGKAHYPASYGYGHGGGGGGYH